MIERCANETQWQWMRNGVIRIISIPISYTYIQSVWRLVNLPYHSPPEQYRVAYRTLYCVCRNRCQGNAEYT